MSWLPPLSCDVRSCVIGSHQTPIWLCPGKSCRDSLNIVISALGSDLGIVVGRILNILVHCSQVRFMKIGHGRGIDSRCLEPCGLWASLYVSRFLSRNLNSWSPLTQAKVFLTRLKEIILSLQISEGTSHSCLHVEKQKIHKGNEEPR